MENKKGKIRIADIVRQNEPIKNHFLLKEYDDTFGTNKEKFYDENKDNEPLKSKIKQLKNFFGERSYGIGYYRPEDEEINLAKELCQIMTGINFPTDLYTSKSNQNKDNEKFNKIVAQLWQKLQQYKMIDKKCLNDDRTLTDDEIKKIIINLPLPSFETEFQKKFNITKPDSNNINFESQKFDKYNLREILTAGDFFVYLYKNEVGNLLGREPDLDFILKNNVYLNESDSFGLDNVEIENLLFNYLKNCTLNRFDTAKQILNFYYKKLKLANIKFNPSFRFAYRILKLYDKKLAETNNQNYANKFEQLRECAKECTKDILGKDSGVIQSVKNIFNYVTMFEMHRTSQFNLTNEKLEAIKKDVNDTLYFMCQHNLITYPLKLEGIRFVHEQVQQLDLSANDWDCFCEFCIMFVTHFIALWNGILFDGPLRIKKSAQLRKFVNFLKGNLIDDISENQEEAEVSDNYQTKYCYEKTNLLKALQNFKRILPEVPKQEAEQDNYL